MSIEEFFPVVDEEGNVIDKASRKLCHSGSFLLHPVVHLHVLNAEGELYMQKRADNKDIQPGKWDTSVGGHVDFGEPVNRALLREAREELGIECFEPKFMMRYKFVSKQEAELVHSFYTVYDGEIMPDPNEIAEGRFWSLSEINANLGKEIFTPNFESEFLRITQEKLLPIK